MIVTLSSLAAIFVTLKSLPSYSGHSTYSLYKIHPEPTFGMVLPLFKSLFMKPQTFGEKSYGCFSKLT